MKKSILIAVSLLSLFSCKKSTSSSSGTTSTTVSTFNVTLNGHTYNTSYTKGEPAPFTTIVASTSSGTNSNNQPCFLALIEINCPNKIFFSISTQKVDPSTALGTYHPAFSAETIFDYGDGGKKYTYDTTSTITVTTSNVTEVKGTFNLTLFYNGSSYPATGDFDYKK